MGFSFSTPLLFDGAFGTYYAFLTGDHDLCERANLHAPDTVRAIHREYLEAGSRAVRTNTFCANIEHFEDLREMYSVLDAGYSLALREARAFDAAVFCSIGHVSDREIAAESYQLCAERFANNGAKNFLFETMDSLFGVEETVAFLRGRVPDCTVFISFGVSQDGVTALGESAAQAVSAAAGMADAVGFNCRTGPTHMRAVIEGLGAQSVPLIALPNAGYPNRVGGRTFFENNPAYFAQKCALLPAAGAAVIGGCCGTTPRHIALLAEALPQGRVSAPTPAVSDEKPRAAAARLESRRGKYVAVELDPPVDADLRFFSDAARQFCAHGADALTVSDSPFSKTRADSLMCAVKLLREGAPDVIPHITCRDKNHIALKGGLLAAHAEGVDKAFIVTGDPPLKTEEVRKSGVFSFNSFELLRFVGALSDEVFASRPFLTGAALNVNAPQFENELVRAEKKWKCGARFFMTQPVFSDEAAARVRQARGALPGGAQLLVGVLPVAGYKNALFLHNEVAGIGIPESLLCDLEHKSPAEQRAVSLANARRVIDALFDCCDGFFLMLPLKKTDYVCELIDYIKQKG